MQKAHAYKMTTGFKKKQTKTLSSIEIPPLPQIASAQVTPVTPVTPPGFLFSVVNVVFPDMLNKIAGVHGYSCDSRLSEMEIKGKKKKKTVIGMFYCRNIKCC